MITNQKLLELLYEAASCYIPFEDLKEDQRDRFDNISYRWCNCEGCRRPLKVGDKIIILQYAGHADKKTLEICLSRSFLKEHLTLTPSIFLLTLIATALHEIVHILFPEFDENQTVDKTWEWLRRNVWASIEEELERKVKEDYDRDLDSP